MVEIIDILKIDLDFKIDPDFKYHRCQDFLVWRERLQELEDPYEIISVSTAINSNEEYMLITITYKTTPQED